MGLGVEVCCRNGLGRGIRDGLGVCFLIGRLGCHGPAYLLFVAKGSWWSCHRSCGSKICFCGEKLSGIIFHDHVATLDPYVFCYCSREKKKDAISSDES